MCVYVSMGLAIPGRGDGLSSHHTIYHHQTYIHRTAAARALTSGGSGLLDLAGERGAVIITRCEALQPHVIPLVQRLLDDGG